MFRRRRPDTATNPARPQAEPGAPDAGTAAPVQSAPRGVQAGDVEAEMWRVLMPAIPADVTTGPDGAALTTAGIEGVREFRARDWARAGYRDALSVRRWIEVDVLNAWVALRADRRGYQPSDPWIPTGFGPMTGLWTRAHAIAEPTADADAGRRNRSRAQDEWQRSNLGPAREHRTDARSRARAALPDDEQNFLHGAVLAERMMVITATGGAPLPPPILVVIAPDQLAQHDLVFRTLLHRHAAHSHRDWLTVVQGRTGWRTHVTITGDRDHDLAHAWAKVVVDLTHPVALQIEFLFHLEQTLETVRQVAGHQALFAIATQDQVDYLTTNALSYDDAAELLTVIPLAPGPQLASSLRYF